MAVRAACRRKQSVHTALQCRSLSPAQPTGCDHRTVLPATGKVRRAVGEQDRMRNGFGGAGASHIAKTIRLLKDRGAQTHLLVRMAHCVSRQYTNECNS